jgi:hypothetical protein
LQLPYFIFLFFEACALLLSASESPTSSKVFLLAKAFGTDKNINFNHPSVADNFERVLLLLLRCIGHLPAFGPDDVISVLTIMR